MLETTGTAGCQGRCCRCCWCWDDKFWLWKQPAEMRDLRSDRPQGHSRLFICLENEPSKVEMTTTGTYLALHNPGWAGHYSKPERDTGGCAWRQSPPTHSLLGSWTRRGDWHHLSQNSVLWGLTRRAMARTQKSSWIMEFLSQMMNTWASIIWLSTILYMPETVYNKTGFFLLVSF